jgi:proto-oncogene serine/threonine-protein kinase Pim-2
MSVFNQNFCVECQEPHYSYFNYPCSNSKFATPFTNPLKATLFCRSCGLKGHVFRNRLKGLVGKPKFLQKVIGSKEFLERKKERFHRTYKLGKLLGQGGFGSVYAGICTQFESNVAIKRVSKKRFSKSQNKYVFDEEIVPLEYKLLSKVQSVKGVIHLHDFYQLQDENIYVMEKPNQCNDLKDYIRDNHPLSEKLARKLFDKIVNGCHQNGVFHRDIKSDNFLVDANNTVYLIDFGCGLLVTEEGYSSDEFWGTDQYIPPEVFNRRTYHAEPATVWSLGILLYEILKDIVPFGNNEFSILYNEVPYQPKFSLELSTRPHQKVSRKIPNRQNKP